MKIGAPFNPYKVFQGVFAPYWLLEHRGISTGAKLCYIRLLGFAGKDARCYPSMETLGASLGVSDRQAREYVKELERSGLIEVEQRGLRKTNVYLFLWTAELEQLCNSVPDKPDDPDDGTGTDGRPAPADRNFSSGQDRNSPSVPARKNSSGLERKHSAGPIRINSAGISSRESSSASTPGEAPPDGTAQPDELPLTELGEQDLSPRPSNRPAQEILHWAKERGIHRLRSDRSVGPPEKEHLIAWSAIFECRGVNDRNRVFAVLDAARTAADRTGEWRNWAFLTLQIQLAAEKLKGKKSDPPALFRPPDPRATEDAGSDWAKAKAVIRRQIPEISFMNWFEGTWQVERSGASLTVAVPDEPTRTYLELEYGDVIRGAICEFGVDAVHFAIRNSSSE